MAQSNAPSAQWTEPAATRVAGRLRRVRLALQGSTYVFSAAEPAAASLVESADGILRVDNDLSIGKRFAMSATGRVFIY